MNSQVMAFLDAVDKLIAETKLKLSRRGVNYPFEKINRDEIENCDSPSIDCLLSYNFPMFTPHKNLTFIGQRRQFGNMIVFAADPVYNNFYVEDINKGKQVMVINQDDGDVMYSCGLTINHFLAAFTVLIYRNIASLRGENEVTVSNWLEQATDAAGGEQYRPFYKFIIS